MHASAQPAPQARRCQPQHCSARASRTHLCRVLGEAGMRRAERATVSNVRHAAFLWAQQHAARATGERIAQRTCIAASTSNAARNHRTSCTHPLMRRRPTPPRARPRRPAPRARPRRRPPPGGRRTGARPRPGCRTRATAKSRRARHRAPRALPPRRPRCLAAEIPSVGLRRLGRSARWMRRSAAWAARAALTSRAGWSASRVQCQKNCIKKMMSKW